MIKTVLEIEGMACPMCEAHVNEAIRNHFKVKKVTSSHSENRTVILSEEALNEDEIRRVIGETGYTLKGISAEEEKKKGLFGFIR
ncbi:MAG: heavy-metal-associated domain-containing protein [Clostridia bacterium]|nr:heavy-metal-associated domain-containing protein [Clostridia bacterium]